MYKKEVLERRTMDENVVQTKYSVSNKVYIVNSCFDGKEQLENLLFNIFKIFMQSFYIVSCNDRRK